MSRRKRIDTQLTELARDARLGAGRRRRVSELDR